MCPAQSDISGLVHGQVIAPGGQAVAGAVVHIENTITGDRSDVTSDAQGDFRFAELIPGGYTLRVQAPGLSDWEADNLAVGLGTVTRLKAALAVRALHRTVLVDARANAAVEAESSGAGEGIAELASEIPNNSQHWSGFAALFGAAAPGTDGGLSFLGLGVPPPTVTWGGMILDGEPNLASAPDQVLVPAVFIFLTVFALNIFGERVRGRLDRRGRG